MHIRLDEAKSSIRDNGGKLYGLWIFIAAQASQSADD